MTKNEFLLWLHQFSRTDHIRQLIEYRLFTEDELDKLKESLIKSGRLRMKNKYRERLSWG